MRICYANAYRQVCIHQLCDVVMIGRGLLCQRVKRVSLRDVLTFVASNLDINGCVLSYFEGTANLHIIQAVYSQLYIVAKCHLFSVVTWKDKIDKKRKKTGILKSGPLLQSLALTLIKHTWVW